MSVKLRASSGTYNVRASEIARDTHKPPLVKTLRCVVHFLDDSDATFEIDVSTGKCSFIQILQNPNFEIQLIFIFFLHSYLQLEVFIYAGISIGIW